MSALIQSAHGVNSATFSAPTQAGSNVIVCLACGPLGTLNGATDDKGNLYTDGASSYSSSTTFNSQADIFYIASPLPPTAGVQVVTASNGGTGNIYIWIFEVATNQSPPTNVPLDIYGNANDGGTATTTPNLSVDLGPTNANDICFAVCSCGGDGGNITSVAAPWTFVTAQGGNGVAYRFVNSGVDFFPTPAFTSSISTKFGLVVETFNAPPPTSSVTVTATDSTPAGDFLVGSKFGSLQQPGRFPLSLVAPSDLLNFSNNFPSYVTPTLPNSILATDTTIAVTTGTGSQFPLNAFEVSVDDEIIFVTSRSGDNLTGCIRGAEGSTAAAHTHKSNVQLLITALSHNQIVAEVVNIENFLGTGGQNVSSSAKELHVTNSSSGNFTVAHGLGVVPKTAYIQMITNGSVYFQTTRYDATNVYLTASGVGQECYIQVYK